MADTVVDTNQVEMAEDDEVMETPVVADIPANHTLYISNINEKIKIESLFEEKRRKKSGEQPREKRNKKNSLVLSGFHSQCPAWVIDSPLDPHL